MARDQFTRFFNKEKPKPFKTREDGEAPSYKRGGGGGKPSARPPVKGDQKPAVRQPPNAPSFAPPAYQSVINRVTEELAAPPENILTGRNPIREALKSGRDIEKLLIARGELSGSAREIIAAAREKRIPVQEVDRSRLDAIVVSHQGMIAYASAAKYSSIEDMFALADKRGEAPFFVILDGLTDPHNLGAIMRTAECAGAHGVILPIRRAAGLTPAAVKAAAGATEYIPIARVTNLTREIQSLKERGVWMFAADSAGEDYLAADLTGPCALVIGAEGEGIASLILQNCDKRVSLPLKGSIGSLNASVAAGILMYAIRASRDK